MAVVRYTLVSEGPSDEALLPVLNWLLTQHLPAVVPEGVRAEFQRRPIKPRGLTARVRAALEDFPGDLLFVHRDADAADGLPSRLEEIRQACAELGEEITSHSHIAVVPVQETEAWLLIDELAIREAVGNREGRVRLGLPGQKSIERLANPKEKLTEALLEASGLTGRKRHKFDIQAAKRLLSETIEDFSPLRQLSAFRRLEADVIAFCKTFETTD